MYVHKFLRWEQKAETHPAGAETANLDHNVLGRAIPGGLLPMLGMKIRSIVLFSEHSAFHRWPAQSAALLLFSSSFKLMRRGAGTYGCLDLKCGAFQLSAQASAEESRCHGSMGRRTRDSVASSMKLNRLDACENRKVVCRCRTYASSHSSQGVLDHKVNEVGVSTTVPGMRAVICY